MKISKSDLIVRIVRNWIGNRIATPFEFVDGSTSYTVDGATVSGSLSISTAILHEAKLDLLLGKTAEEKQVVAQWGLDSQKTIRDSFVKDRTKAIQDLNLVLETMTFIATNYFTLADIALYATLYNVPFMVSDRTEYPNVIRYFDTVQHIVKENTKDLGLKITEFDLVVPFVPKTPVEKVKVAKPEDVKKDAKDVKKDPKEAKKDSKESKPQDPKKDGAKVKKEEPKGIDPSKLDVRVGKILSVERHPDAESLYVETVDLGEAEPRTVVSGLVKYLTPEELNGQTVMLLCNLKPAKMRGIESQAMVLCATSADGNTVEFLQPPAGAKPGDKATFDGFQGEPEVQLKSKQKIWENIQPHLITNAKCQATFTLEGKESLLKTAVGPCFVKSVKGAPIK